MTTIVWLSSCDGTRQRNKGNRLFDDSYKATTHFQTKEIPEGYAEIVVDTVLTNHFTAQTKYHSTDEIVLEIENKKHEAIQKTVYKEFHSDVSVYYKDQLVLKKKIKKDLFKDENEDFWDKSIMHSIAVDEIASSENNIVFTVTFYNTDKEHFIDYKLIIDKIGDFHIEEYTV
ncbi:hypothetical protein [Galbibacter sp. EGI 63066]|uniref:hypothetical protein n=1 Tax=Galbibacter sp. EGI 63066 TaxID=2993559 RepID=UPI002248FDA0|nr:hypothetical protein [Galbibacter sp. EGI 63066]